MPNYQLQIVTQQEVVFTGEVTALTLPGEEGYFGVLANHAPIIGVIGSGKAQMRVGKDEKSFEVSGGFFEMKDNKATLLVDTLSGF
ncbi:MAG: ATP synthase F1 subunit epsilon [Candidatus Sumerlaeia bacterium]|nr:ATP synthase F1 subunit epsilon [Candidatus Sumerlaeia bacterium]